MRVSRGPIRRPSHHVETAALVFAVLVLIAVVLSF